MLSTYGYFLSRTIMFWCCVMWKQLRLPSAWHPNSMQINPTHSWTVSAGRKNLVNFNFFKYRIRRNYRTVRLRNYGPKKTPQLPNPLTYLGNTTKNYWEHSQLLTNSVRDCLSSLLFNESLASSFLYITLLILCWRNTATRIRIDRRRLNCDTAL